MTTSVEKLDAIRRKIKIEVAADLVDKAFARAMEKVNKEAKVPGFRAGKIPEHIIMQRFGPEVEVEAIKQVVRESYPEALRGAEVVPLSEPQIDPEGKIERGKPFSFAANVEVYPDVVVKDYQGMSLTRQKVEVADEEVDFELKRLQQQMTQLEPAPEGQLDVGMVAMIDFKGTAGGKTFPGSEAENYVVDFGTGALLQEFELQIRGMKAGEERDIAFHYPTDFFRLEVAGKKGEFRVKVRDVRRKVVPELTDEFAKELGEFQDLNAVKTDLKKRIGEYKEMMMQASLREQAIRELIAKHQDLEVPTALIDAELKNMLEQLRGQLESQGKKIEDAHIDPNTFVRENIKEATDRARGFMLAREISTKEQLAVSEEELNARIEQMAAQYRDTPQRVREYLDKNNMLENLRSKMLFEKTLDFVVGKAKIKEEKPKKEKK